MNIRKFVGERRVAALILSGALAMALVYSFVFAPLAKKLRLKYQECRMCEGQVADARNLIETGRKIDEEYGGRTLLSEHQAAVGLEEFTRYGKSLGIRFLSIRPQTIVKKENAFYKIWPIDLSLEADAGQFVQFIGSIDELKKAIVTVGGFNITPDKDDRKKLRIQMTIIIYLSLQVGSPEGA